MSWTKVLSLTFGAATIATPAYAFKWDVNDDVRARLDTTVRYNLGWRMQDRDPRIAGNAAYDQGDYLFDKHDLINNRVDLLLEGDLVWRDTLGARVTAAGWFDDAYGNYGKSNPALPNGPTQPSYIDNEFSAYTKRYYHGPSGEFLDAFVWANTEIDGKPLNVKVGRHAVIWGEGLFGNSQAISYSQTPNDARKSTVSPNASAKETALPLSQVSGTFKPTADLTLLAQYSLEWRTNRSAEGGTFFGAADVILEGPNAFRTSPIKGDKGDLGVGARWSPHWLDGTLGLYYRKFDEKNAWSAQVTPLGLAAVYLKDVELLGVSLAKNVGGISLGAEISQRRNGALNTSGNAGPAQRYEGAIGNTWHALLNGTMTFGTTRFFDSASLAAELTWSKLDKVTRNPQLYKAPGYSAACTVRLHLNGCTDDPFTSLGFSFTPAWSQIRPGIGMTLPIFVSYAQGNAPSNGGGVDGLLIYKFGVSFNVYQRHLIDIAYTGYGSRIDHGIVMAPAYKDKGWLGISYQTSF
jgi:hypothetical protein